MGAVLHVAAFADNYIWLIRGTAADRVAIVDPGDADAVLAALAALALVPEAILCTHHHGDHVGGNAELTARYHIPVYGPAHERIPGLTHALHDGARVTLDELGLEFRVLEVPGHTAGHIAYYGSGMLFCGDTLFGAGCGRLFEGTPAQLFASLARLAALPAATAVYCAHEYTLGNLAFALAVEPANDAVHARHAAAREQRAADAPTLPSSIGLELATNPFLRCDAAGVRAAAESHAGRQLPTALDVFTELRRWKDGFQT